LYEFRIVLERGPNQSDELADIVASLRKSVPLNAERNASTELTELCERFLCVLDSVSDTLQEVGERTVELILNASKELEKSFGVYWDGRQLAKADAAIRKLESSQLLD
jgi:hypothetical protein